MQVNIHKDYQALSQATTNFIVQVLKDHPNGLLCFAGGDTPVLTLQLLVKEHNKGTINLHNYYYIELDEWVGLGEENPGSCISYLNEHLFHPARIPASRIHVFNAKAPNLEQECQLANEYIEKHHQLTLALLGVGINGHLGFNEPGTDFSLKAHVVQLHNHTKEVGQKYFKNEVSLNLGITLGLKQLLDSKYIVLLANGPSKKQAIENLLNEQKPTTAWPLTALKSHENTHVFIADK